MVVSPDFWTNVVWKVSINVSEPWVVGPWTSHLHGLHEDEVIRWFSLKPTDFFCTWKIPSKKIYMCAFYFGKNKKYTQHNIYIIYISFHFIQNWLPAIWELLFSRHWNPFLSTSTCCRQFVDASDETSKEKTSTSRWTADRLGFDLGESLAKKELQSLLLHSTCKLIVGRWNFLFKDGKNIRGELLILGSEISQFECIDHGWISHVWWRNGKRMDPVEISRSQVPGQWFEHLNLTGWFAPIQRQRFGCRRVAI